MQIYATLGRYITPQRLVEIAASVFTLAGQAIGSTSLRGATFYGLATVFWWWLTIRTRMWGLIPVNLASAVVTSYTMWVLIS